MNFAFAQPQGHDEGCGLHRHPRVGGLPAMWLVRLAMYVKTEGVLTIVVRTSNISFR